MQENFLFLLYGCYMYIYLGAGTEFAEKLWGGQNLLFAFQWCHHVNPPVVQPFCKIGQIGEHHGIDTWLCPSWWYSN